MTENIFEKMAADATKESMPKEVDQPITSNGEIDFNSMSDTAVGEKKKYTRSDLDGKTLKVKSAQLFAPDTSEEPQSAMKNKDVKYWRCPFILTYDHTNVDGVNDREYLSGAIAFRQKNGEPSDIKLYNQGAINQVAQLWEMVAKFKGLDPMKMSPRQFMATLNSGLTVKIKKEKIKFDGRIHEKNLPAEIIKTA